MESKKQLKAQLTNEISKRFASRIKELEEKNKSLERLLAFERKTSFELAEQVTELECELHQYKDWNERLQDFTNMSEEDRIEFLRNENQKYKTQLKLDELSQFASCISSLIFK